MIGFLHASRAHRLLSLNDKAPPFTFIVALSTGPAHHNTSLLLATTCEMPKQQRNPRTGRLLRQTLHYTNFKQRASRGLRPEAKKEAKQLFKAGQILSKPLEESETLTVILLALLVLAWDDDDLFDDDDRDILLILACVSIMMYAYYLTRHRSLRDRWDEIMDIPEEVELQPVERYPIKRARIDEYPDDDVARNDTNFSKNELRQFNQKFGLDEEVRVPCGNSMFSLRTSFDLLSYQSGKFLGGDDRRWSYVFGFFMEHLAIRYRNLILLFLYIIHTLVQSYIL